MGGIRNMKKIYNSPNIEITYIKSESVITVSGFKTNTMGGTFTFDNNGTNKINF